MSASYHEAPGLITMSWTTDQAVLTEAIVHEYHHQKLHALMCVDPLLLGPVHIPVYYSPWRNDPRPLRGLLHAAFTFQAILEFYNQLLLANVLEQTESVSQRIYKCSRQVAIALDSLSQHTHFSTLGYALFESLKTNLTRQQTLMPIVSEEGKQSVDALLTSHRNEWERQYGSLARNLPLSTSTPSAALSPGPAVPEQQKQLEQRVLQALQLPPEFSLTALGDPESQHDPVIDCVRLEQREQRLDAVAVLVQEIAPSGSLFLKLTGAHVAYIADGYERAEQLYKACLHHQPTNTLFWQYYAFTLRHLRQWAASRFILQNLQRLVDPHVFSDGQSATSDDVVEDRLALLRQIDPSAAEVLPEASPFPTNVSALPRQDYPFKHFFSGKKLQRFFEFAPTGGQFPSSLAVLHKLKPTMDLWIPPHGWAAFQSLVEELGLVYHVDTYFDPYSPQLDHFSPDSFTTTRAALSRTFGEHTQAHVFLSYDLEHLYPAVSSGWYPLVIDSHLVSKHMPDHNKFGEALGYPACCQRFFLERNDWHSDNTFYAAYHNTHMVPQKFSNGSLRHTLFSLVPYIPCSMGCQATIHYASTLHALMASEFPAYAQEVELHLSSPILCLSELRVYRFIGTLMEEAGILLLLRRAGILAVGATLLEVDDSNYILAQQLYKELGGLPLALDQAAAFINANLQEVPKSRINACPGVLRLVEFGGDPQSVPQHVIDTIARQLNRLNGQPFQIAHNFSPGDVVQVKYGPLQDLELVFAGSMTPGGRVHVLLELLGRLKEVQVEYAREKCVHELFEAQVERAPDAIALTCDDQMLSYNALNCHANQLAHQLIAQGVTAETLVGIYVDRSLEMLVDLSQRTSL